MGKSRPSSIEWPAEDRELLSRFLEKVREAIQPAAVVLYGSFARGDFDRRSDLDVLVVVDDPDPSALSARLARLVTELRPHREINVLATDLTDLEPAFVRNVFREGLVLAGKLLLTPEGLGLHPRTLLSYDLSGLSPARKVSVSRHVRGYVSRKKVGGRSRVYRYEGLAGKRGATVLSPSALLLPTEVAAEFAAQLRKMGARVSLWEVFAPT